MLDELEKSRLKSNSHELHDDVTNKPLRFTCRGVSFRYDAELSQ